MLQQEMAFLAPTILSPRGLPSGKSCVCEHIVRRPRTNVVTVAKHTPSAKPQTPKSSSSQKPNVPSPVLTSSEEPASSAEVFLASLGLSKEDVGRVLSRFPKIQTDADVAASAAPVIEYLRSSLRLNRKQIARAIRFAPQIIYRNVESFNSRLDFLDTVARIPPADRPTAVSKCPHILWMDLKLAGGVVQLIVDACPLITPATLGCIFARVPQALVTPPDRIRLNIDRIRDAGVCDTASMARVIAKAPLSLVYNVDSSIQKRLEYLSKELDLPISTVGKVLVAVPQVLDWSVDKLIRPRIQLLTSIVGSDAIGTLIDKVPIVIGFEDAIDRVLWLREQVGLSDEQIRIVIREAPAVLTYSVVGNLAPKWAFISETMGGTKDDVVAAPRESLCANLQQRAMPRYAFLASMGRHDVAVTDVLRGSDTDFCKNVAQCDPAQFREYVDNDTYLLFFSQLL